MQPSKVTVSPSNIMFCRAFPPDSEQKFLGPIVSKKQLVGLSISVPTHSMLVVPDLPLDGDDTDTSNVNIPPVQVVTLGECGENPGINRVGIDDLEFGKPNPLFESRGRGNSRHHHQLNQLLSLDSQFPPLGLL